MTAQTPQEVFDWLKAGNQRFVSDSLERPNTDARRREELLGGQSPRAVVLACSDSRVPVELLFDAGFGDFFVIRTAGESLDPAVLGSLEFAVEALGVKLIVVMGHEKCGAVAATKAALDEGHLPDGWQRTLVEKVAPSLLLARAAGLSSDDDLERAHVNETIEQIMTRIPSLQHHLDSGELGVVGLHYLLSDGRVETTETRGVS